MKGEHDDAEGLPGTQADKLDGLLSRLRAEAGRPVGASRLGGWAAAAARAAEGTGRARHRPHHARIPVATWKRRVATALSEAVVVVGGVSGLTWAANGSAPGDALYGVDRALERVGIGRGGAAERLQETQGLVESGDIPGGLNHAAEVVVGDLEGGADEGSQAEEALEEAAARVAGQGSEASSEVRSQVAVLLTYLAENAGQVDGRQVALLAREIAGTQNPHASGPPDGVPPVDAGPPASVPPVNPPAPPATAPPVDTGPPANTPPVDELPSIPADLDEIDDGKPWMPVG